MLEIAFIVRRFNPETDSEPRWEHYTTRTHAGMTVLEGLHQIQEEQDSTLSWRYSCRMGVCGSCAMVINGRPGLACNTQIRDVSTSAVRLQPLSNFQVVKDLIPDLSPMFEKHASLSTYLVEHDTQGRQSLMGEFIQSPEELSRYLQFSHCIKCGACMAACPTFAIDGNFLGPMPLTAAYRYNVDTRDEGLEARREKLSAVHGVFHCHYVAECSRVCPKGVDPARAIQLMKRDLVLALLRPKRESVQAHPPPPDGPANPRKDIPRAPDFTVGAEP